MYEYWRVKQNYKDRREYDLNRTDADKLDIDPIILGPSAGQR